jgi:hypothetical protein
LLAFTIISLIQGLILQKSNVNPTNYQLKTFNVVTGNVEVDMYLYLVKRLFELTLWQLPIIYVFRKPVRKVYEHKTLSIVTTDSMIEDEN